MIRWLLHVAGIDTQASFAYDAWSGFIPAALAFVSATAIVASAVSFYHRWSCQHAWWCPRHGKHELADPQTSETHHYCHAHHPGPRSRRWTPAERRSIWLRQQ